MRKERSSSIWECTQQGSDGGTQRSITKKEKRMCDGTDKVHHHPITTTSRKKKHMKGGKRNGAPSLRKRGQGF